MLERHAYTAEAREAALPTSPFTKRSFSHADCDEPDRLGTEYCFAGNDGCAGMLIEAARAIALAVRSSRLMNVRGFAAAFPPSSGGVSSGVGQCACRESSAGADGASASGRSHAGAAVAVVDCAGSYVHACSAGVGGKAALTQSCADDDTAVGRGMPGIPTEAVVTDVERGEEMVRDGRRWATEERGRFASGSERMSAGPDRTRFEVGGYAPVAANEDGG